MYLCLKFRTINMKRAKFWVDHCFEAGDAGVCHRYWFYVELTDDEFEELYQVWFSNNSELNSWDTNWQGHDELFEKLNVTAYHALNDMLKKNEPDFADPLDAYWEISEETEDNF